MKLWQDFLSRNAALIYEKNVCLRHKLEIVMAQSNILHIHCCCTFCFLSLFIEHCISPWFLWRQMSKIHCHTMFCVLGNYCVLDGTSIFFYFLSGVSPHIFHACKYHNWHLFVCSMYPQWVEKYTVMSAENQVGQEYWQLLSLAVFNVFITSDFKQP